MKTLETPTEPKYDAALADARRKALAIAKRPVPPAQLVRSLRHDDGDYTINTLVFTTPLRYLDKEGEERIQVTVRAVLAKTGKTGGSAKGSSEPTECDPMLDVRKPIAAYLVGGPGSDNPPTAHKALNDFYTEKGFQILYMDYRGMGDSTEVRMDKLNGCFDASKKNRTACRLADFDTDEEKAEYLTHFRQDNIVRDLEAVRVYLCGEALKKDRKAKPVKLTLIGQSYGGWMSYTYLSLFPAGLDMVIITGGVPPVGQSAETVYHHTWDSMTTATERFYKNFPKHVEYAKLALKWIDTKTADGKIIAMPGGGNLTKERFLCLGRTLGTTDGETKVARALEQCAHEIQSTGGLSKDMLQKIEGWIRFEERPLYCILQEPIYTEIGLPASDWAAEKVAKTLDAYKWLANGGRAPAGRPMFYAEHIFKFHYEQFKAMRGLKGAADLLARKKDWAPIFDAKQLSENTVPIASLAYAKDIFIDPRLSKITAMKTKNIVHQEHRDLMHTAVKDRSATVLPMVWKLLGDAVAESCGVGAQNVSNSDRKDAASLLRCLHKTK